MSGIFLSLEGIDGSGKTTQAARLVEILRGAGHRVISVREPGSTALAERVRQVLLDPAASAISPRAELLLYVACRAQLVDEVIRPALDAGAVVVSDRFADSTLAYQGYGRELGPEVVREANMVATGGLAPALTFVLDIPPEEAVRRRGASAADRLEGEARAFHERVRRGFLEIAHREPERVSVVDGGLPPEEVASRILDLIDSRFPELLADRPRSIHGRNADQLSMRTDNG